MLVVTCPGHLLQQSLYHLSQFLWFRRLEGACLGSPGLGSFVFLIGQWLGAGMAPLYEVPWPPTWTLHTASWGFLTAWWPCGLVAVRLHSRLAAPGESAGAHTLGTWCSCTCLLRLPWQSTTDQGLTRQNCVFSQSWRSLSLWLIGRLLLVSLRGPPSVLVSVLISSAYKDISHVGLGSCWSFSWPFFWNSQGSNWYLHSWISVAFICLLTEPWKTVGREWPRHCTPGSDTELACWWLLVGQCRARGGWVCSGRETGGVSATLHKASSFSSFASWAPCLIDGRENGQSPSGL